MGVEAAGVGQDPDPRGAQGLGLRADRGAGTGEGGAGQNLLPGRAKCQPVAAEYRLGLMPQNSTRSGAPGGGSTSGMVRFLAAASSSGLGRATLATRPTSGFQLDLPSLYPPPFSMIEHRVAVGMSWKNPVAEQGVVQ